MSSTSDRPAKAAVNVSGNSIPAERSSRSDWPFATTKIQPSHQEKLAIVYVRQSSPQQVLEHRESGELQYNLARQAVALGWPEERVLVIDEDQGQSAKWAEARQGFQQLLAEVSLDHVGLVLGIEMSRLARSCRDWYQLLELCAFVPHVIVGSGWLVRSDQLQRPIVIGTERHDERGGVAYPPRTF